MQQESDICLNLLTNSAIKKKQHSPEEIAKAFRIDEYGSIWWNKFTHGNKVVEKPVDRLGKDGYSTILLPTGGRYLGNPLPLRQHVKVYYEPGDYKAQCEAWERCVTPISETRRDQWWRVVLRRCGLPA